MTCYTRAPPANLPSNWIINKKPKYLTDNTLSVGSHAWHAGSAKQKLEQIATVPTQQTSTLAPLPSTPSLSLAQPASSTPLSNQALETTEPANKKAKRNHQNLYRRLRFKEAKQFADQSMYKADFDDIKTILH